MNRIEVYTTDSCRWCVRAKSLLRARGLDFVEIDIATEDQIHAVEMNEWSGRCTVPQVFVTGALIGER